MVYKIEIDITPKAKERPRFSKGNVYTTTKTSNYEKEIGYRWKTKYKNVLNSPLKLTTVFSFKYPKDFKKRKNKACTKRPDLDNLEKAVMDGLNKIAYVDDSLVVEKVSSKRYAEKDSVYIQLEEI